MRVPLSGHGSRCAHYAARERCALMAQRAVQDAQVLRRGGVGQFVARALRPCVCGTTPLLRHQHRFQCGVVPVRNEPCPRFVVVNIVCQEVVAETGEHVDSGQL